MTGTSGRRCAELFRKSGPLGSLVRMCLESSIWRSTRCYLTWKVKVTPARRLLFQQTFIIPAAGVDAPHRRDRIAILAYSGCNRRARQFGKSPEGGCNTNQINPTVAESNSFPHADRDGGDARRPESERQQWKAGTANGGYDVADTMRLGSTAGIADTPTGEKRKSAEFINGSATVSDADHSRLQISGHESGFQTISAENGVEYGYSHVPNPESAERQRERREAWGRRTEFGCGGWWPAEPDVGRVANGVPSRVDRLKCLGNAVVPAQFYPFFKYIAEIEANQ